MVIGGGLGPRNPTAKNVRRVPEGRLNVSTPHGSADLRQAGTRTLSPHDPLMRPSGTSQSDRTFAHGGHRPPPITIGPAGPASNRAQGPGYCITTGPSGPQSSILSRNETSPRRGYTTPMLLVAQGFDRIHMSGLASRVDSEDEPHAERDEQRQSDGPWSNARFERVDDGRQQVG